MPVAQPTAMKVFPPLATENRQEIVTTSIDLDIPKDTAWITRPDGGLFNAVCRAILFPGTRNGPSSTT